MLSPSSDQKIPGTRQWLWQNPIMLPCIKLAAIKAATEVILLAAKINRAKKENTYSMPSTTSTHINTREGKATARKMTYSKSNTPTKAEMDHCKGEEACFCCGESGDMAKNDQRKKLKPTMFPSLTKAKIIAKANMGLI